MSKKKFLLSGALLAAGGIALCQAEVPAISIIPKEGGEMTQVPVGESVRISFEGTQMTLQNVDTEMTFDVNDIQKIVFDITVTSVDEIKTQLGESLEVEYIGGIFSFRTADEAPISVNLYDIKGILLKTFAGNGHYSLDTNDLLKGTYIIKANDKLIKYIK